MKNGTYSQCMLYVIVETIVWLKWGKHRQFEVNMCAGHPAVIAFPQHIMVFVMHSNTFRFSRKIPNL